MNRSVQCTIHAFSLPSKKSNSLLPMFPRQGPRVGNLVHSEIFWIPTYARISYQVAYSSRTDSFRMGYQKGSSRIVSMTVPSLNEKTATVYFVSHINYRQFRIWYLNLVTYIVQYHAIPSSRRDAATPHLEMLGRSVCTSPEVRESKIPIRNPDCSLVSYVLL